MSQSQLLQSQIWEGHHSKRHTANGGGECDVDKGDAVQPQTVLRLHATQGNDCIDMFQAIEQQQ